jgi:Nif-specific regulatory protein
MSPRLIVISGSHKGTIIALAEDEVLIGREPTNAIYLNEPSVSRRHCLIKCEPTQSDNVTAAPELDGKEVSAQLDQRENAHRFVISDLESYNGTFVNRLPVKEHPLAHGDQIAVGDVVLLFLLHDTEVESNADIPSSEGDLITRSTVRLRAEEALYLRPEKVAEELPATSRVARDLNALLKISRAISSTRNVEQLNQQLFELILEVIPAERIAILLADTTSSAGGSSRGWNRSLGADDSIQGSRTITSQVLREGVALLSNDLFAAESLATPASLLDARICSVLCVPLIIFEKTLGVIYLDTSDRGARFDEDHLQLLTAIAGIAAAGLENARRLEWVERENQRLQEEIRIEHQMIGQSPAMRSIYQFIGKAGPSEATVLIRGESGTGKELAARAIHENSGRAEKAFVAINGATLSETLLESELFGHEKGAFTGAIAQKRGKLEFADGGTLFLDEVGELASSIQAKLLRVLQEREFERVGGTRPIKIDVRLVTATNKDLEDAVRQGSFRQDLYYRLNVVSMTMPPLKDRGEDVQLLASYFASVYSKRCKRRINGISPEARAVLRAYAWPGNVRELENAIERAVVLGSTEAIIPDDLPEALFEALSSRDVSLVGYHDRLKEAKKQIVIKALEDANGNYTQAARELGLHPTNLHRLVRNLNLRPSASK